MFFIKTVKKNTSQAGFSLMELMVVMALLTIILSTSIFSYHEFGRKIELENSTYSLALAIREIQVYGLNRNVNMFGSGSFDPQVFGGNYSYGVHFSKSTSPDAPNNKNFVLFVDNNITGGGEGIINNVTDCMTRGRTGTSAQDICYSKISIQKGNFIKTIRALNTSGFWDDLNDVNISFKRPNPDVVIKSGADRYSRVRIIVSDPSDSIDRCIEIGVAGDISIKNSC